MNYLISKSIDDYFKEAFLSNNQKSKHSYPKSNVGEDEKNYYVEVELPGIDKSDINIICEKDNLKIFAEHKATKGEDSKKTYHLIECSSGSFERDFSFLTEIENEKSEASFSNGILSIVLPKKTKKESGKVLKIK